MHMSQAGATFAGVGLAPAGSTRLITAHLGHYSEYARKAAERPVVRHTSQT